jgi:hypothetical protein
LCMWQWNFWLHKMWGISCLTENRLVPQEGLCCMQAVRQLVNSYTFRQHLVIEQCNVRIKALNQQYKFCAAPKPFKRAINIFYEYNWQLNWGFFPTKVSFAFPPSFTANTEISFGNRPHPLLPTHFKFIILQNIPI